MNAKLYVSFLLGISILHVAHAMHESYQEKFDTLYNDVHAYKKTFEDQKKILEHFIKEPQFNIKFISSNGETILSVAVKNNQNDIVEKLLSKPGYKTIINQPDSFGDTPLYSATNRHNEVITALLLNHGANPNIGSKNASIPLHEAVKLSSPQLVKMLLGAGSKINKQDNLGYTPLYVALQQTDSNELTTNVEEIITLLLEKGANPNIASKDGFTPLHRAVALQSLVLIKLLLQYGANPLLKPTKKIQKKSYNPATGTYETITIKEETNDSPLEMAKKIVAHEIEFTNALAKTRSAEASEKTDERLEKAVIGREIFGLLYKKGSELEKQAQQKLSPALNKLP